MRWGVLEVVVESVTWNVRTMSSHSWLDIVDIVSRAEANANKQN